jgi:hypothetical protein
MTGAVYEVEKMGRPSAIVSGVGAVAIGTSVAGTSCNNLVFFANEERTDIIAAFPPGSWIGVKRLTAEEWARREQSHAA